MNEKQKPINRTFNNLKTQDKKTNQGKTVQELSNRSAGIVVVRKNKQGELLVLLMRAYNYWDFPKGKIEIGERVIDAAIRETGEEAGLKDLHFVWGRDHTQTLPYGIVQKISYYFLAETHERHIVMQINPESGQPEHEEYRWLTFKEAHKIVVPSISEVLDWAQEKIHNLTPSYLKQVSTRPAPKPGEAKMAKKPTLRHTPAVSTSAHDQKPLEEKNNSVNKLDKLLPLKPNKTEAAKHKAVAKPQEPLKTNMTKPSKTTYLSMKGKSGKGSIEKTSAPKDLVMIDSLRPSNIPTKFKKTVVASSSLKRK